MVFLKVVDNWYICAEPANFVVGKWDGYTYVPKGGNSLVNFRDIDEYERPPYLTEIVRFPTLGECFEYLNQQYQLEAFSEADTGYELFEILINLNKSFQILSDAVTDIFTKQKKEIAKQKRLERQEKKERGV